MRRSEDLSLGMSHCRGLHKVQCSSVSYRRNIVVISAMVSNQIIVSFLAIAVGYIAYYMYTPDVPSNEKSILNSIFYLSLAPPMRRLIMRSRFTTDEDLANLIANVLSGGMYGMLILSVLGTIGIDTSPLVAGVGITGFTIGFALKEIATNFLSGILLVLSKPFRKGQYLKVLAVQPQMEGTVESIDARYVILNSKDGNVIMIPSAIVYSNAILVGPAAPQQGKKV